MSGPHPCTDAAHDPGGPAFQSDRRKPAMQTDLAIGSRTSAGQYESDVMRVAGHFDLSGWLGWANPRMSGALGVNLWSKQKGEILK